MVNIVPVVHSLENIYTSDPSKRFQSIANCFSKHFDGLVPHFYARAPGRVNLIGEHVDYSGYGVLPMALEVDSVIACSMTENSIDPSVLPVFVLCIFIRNTNIDKFQPKNYTFNIDQSSARGSLGDNILIDRQNHHWSNYVLCGIRGALSMIKASDIPLYKQYNLYMVVDGTVPMGSGLSSSSALVCSSLLATCRAFNIHNKISKEELAQLAANSERYGMNVQIGGMDQAISFLGEKNQAQYITFEPKLDHQGVSLPIGISFVVAHTLVGSHKNESAAHNYNRRVIECRLATALLAKALLNGTVLTEYHTLHWLQADQLNESLENMIQYCNRYLIRDSYDLEHVAAELGLASVDELKKRFFGNIELAHEKDFKLRQRALHVFSEAKRVLDAVKLCSETNLDSDQTAIEFGKLMNQSHFSCRDLFECSCKELNELTEYSRSANGCLGSRLTGAGWGGCCVSLVKDSSVQEFIEFIWNKYYKDNPNAKDLNRNEYLFASHPASGAAIYEPNK